MLSIRSEQLRRMFMLEMICSYTCDRWIQSTWPAPLSFIYVSTRDLVSKRPVSFTFSPHHS